MRFSSLFCAILFALPLPRLGATEQSCGEDLAFLQRRTPVVELRSGAAAVAYRSTSAVCRQVLKLPLSGITSDLEH